MNTEKIEEVVKDLKEIVVICPIPPSGCEACDVLERAISLIQELEAEVEHLHKVLECSEDVEILKSENAHLLDENANLQNAYDMAQSAAIARRLSKV